MLLLLTPCLEEEIFKKINVIFSKLKVSSYLWKKINLEYKSILQEKYVRFKDVKTLTFQNGVN